MPLGGLEALGEGAEAVVDAEIGELGDLDRAADGAGESVELVGGPDQRRRGRRLADVLSGTMIPPWAPWSEIGPSRRFMRAPPKSAKLGCGTPRRAAVSP
jgi:hypothetical protein